MLRVPVSTIDVRLEHLSNANIIYQMLSLKYTLKKHTMFHASIRIYTCNTYAAWFTTVQQAATCIDLVLYLT